jgi:hypothetical protein
MTRIAGLPNTESNRALDMYMKTRYLAERNGGIVFATGTPISNTMAEMYTLQRYLAPETLKAAGVEHFDAWAANFGEAVTSLELAPDGSGYRMHTRFAKFVNLPELLSMFRSFADVQTADMLHLPRPVTQGGKPQITAAPGSPELKAYVETLVNRAQKLRTSKIDPSVDNMLKITGDGRKAALDMRLVDPFAQPDDTKVSRAIENIHRACTIYQSGHERQRHRSPGGRPRGRRAHLRRDQGHRLGQPRRHGKSESRYRNPQARPAAVLAYQPAAQHQVAGEEPA